MKISFGKYPVDIILCMIWSLILLPTALLDIEGTIRIILGLPFILFIPGYVLIFVLFPTIKTDRGIDIIERIAFSFGLSIAVVPLLGLCLNYTPWGIRLESILFSIFIFIIGVGAIAIYRWIKTSPGERFTISFDLSFKKSESKLNKALTVIIVVSIIIALASIVFVTITPKIGEQFTELYLLSPDGTIEGYPSDLAVGENASVIIGIVNHEYKTINYTVEIWLLEQTFVFNESTNENETVYNHMWYIDKMSVVLNHTSIPLNIEESWEPQWDYNFTFNIKKGDFKLLFLLFTTPTGEYTTDVDYKDIAKQKISSAYRRSYLWISVSNLPKISNVLVIPDSTFLGEFVNISCVVFDVDGVDEVYLNIRDPDGIWQIFSISGNRMGDTYYYNKTYSVVGNYSFYIWANDTTGNASISSGLKFSVTDIPTISDVWVSPPSALQGGFVNISCLIFDADGIDKVFLNISDPDGIVQNFSITGNNTGLIYYCNRTYSVVGEYSYFIWVNDTIGNTNMSDVKQFTVIFT